MKVCRSLTTSVFVACIVDGKRGGGGLSSLELFSMGLKATGSYMSRALSYRGADFELATVDIDPAHACASRRI